jgi:two-component system, LuxR family, response regulator FixJ
MQPTDPRPSVEPTSTETGGAFGEGSGSSASGRVLVIASDDAVRNTLAILATADGCEVLALPHGGAALEAIRTWSPSAVLLDLQGPDEEARELVAPYLEAAAGGPAVIVLSHERLSSELGARAGVAAALPKPFDVGQLLDLLDRFADCC